MVVILIDSFSIFLTRDSGDVPIRYHGWVQLKNLKSFMIRFRISLCNVNYFIYLNVMLQLCPVQNLNFYHNLQESPSAKTCYTGVRLCCTLCNITNSIHRLEWLEVRQESWDCDGGDMVPW